MLSGDVASTLCAGCPAQLPEGSPSCRRYCSSACKHRARNERKKQRRPNGGFAYEQTDEFKERRRARDRRTKAARRDEVNAQKRAYRTRLYDQWRNARRADARYGSSGYSGSLEEYADYRERRALGCSSSDHWRAWLPLPPQSRSTFELDQWENDGGAPRRYSQFSRIALGDAAAFRLRYDKDPEFNLRQRMRSQFAKWLRGDRPTKPSFIASLPYTFEQLRAHIEARFLPGMSWTNYGEWHVDHRVPKNLFDPTNADDVRACWALDNLRPLWAVDNMRRPRDGSDLTAEDRGSLEPTPTSRGCAAAGYDTFSAAAKHDPPPQVAA